MPIIPKYTVCINDSMDEYYPRDICVVDDYDVALNSAMNLNEIMFGERFAELLSQSGNYGEVYEVFMENGGFGVGNVDYYNTSDPSEIISDFKESAFEAREFME